MKNYRYLTLNAFASRLSNPLVQDLYGLWLDAIVDDLPPTKTDFPIQELPFKMWQYLFFCDYTSDKRFYCVHNGTAIVRFYGKEATGKYMDECLSEDLAKEILPLYHGVMEEGNAVYYEGDLPTGDESFMTYARLLLPVRAADEDRYGHLLSIMIKTGDQKTYKRPYQLQRRNIVWDTLDLQKSLVRRSPFDRGTLGLF